MHRFYTCVFYKLFLCVKPAPDIVKVHHDSTNTEHSPMLQALRPWVVFSPHTTYFQLSTEFTPRLGLLLALIANIPLSWGS